MQRFEQTDVNVRWVAVGGLALLAAMVAVVVGVSFFEVAETGVPISLGRPPDLVDRLTPAPTPPAPRLEAFEGEQLATYRAAALERLHSYGWVDRANGRVHIPIEQAIDELAQRAGAP